jgi:hypothetical protein
MNDPSARKERSEKTSGRRPPERSNEVGRHAVAELDERLELRERLVAIIDALDAGDSDEGAINTRALLADLDGAAA